METDCRLIEKIEKLKKLTTPVERERLVYEWVKMGICNFKDFHDLLSFINFVEVLNSEKSNNP